MKIKNMQGIIVDIGDTEKILHYIWGLTKYAEGEALDILINAHAVIGVLQEAGVVKAVKPKTIKQRKAGFYTCKIKYADNKGTLWIDVIVALDMPSKDAKGDFMPYDNKVFYYFQAGDDMKYGEDFKVKSLKYIGDTI
jgi:hypothetical protein